MEIRQIRREEADEVSRIYAKSWKAAYRGIVPQGYLDQLPELRWSPFLAENLSNSFVMLKDGEYVGTASVGPARDKRMHGWGEIGSIYLLPERFGTGCGSPLLNFCVERLNQMGFRNIYLWTLEENVRARAFYEKHGFRHDGKKMTCEIGGADLTEVRYVRHLEDE